MDKLKAPLKKGTKVGELILEFEDKKYTYNLIINEEVKDDDIKFVTITAVEITNDLSYAKVYFTNLIDTDREKVTKALNRASSFIRGKLFDEVEIRKMPELTFVYDESIEYGNKIEKIIDEKNILSSSYRSYSCTSSFRSFRLISSIPRTGETKT